MKKFILLLSLVGIVSAMSACGADECEDGATVDACGQCPADDSSPEA